jgi:hypothetical protein
MASLTRVWVRAGAATAVSQVLVMAGSSLLGLLVARLLGSSAGTDGFFAANAIYAIALFTAQSLRTTAPATLLDPRPGTFPRHLRAVGLIAVVVLALFAAAVASADLLVPSGAVDSFRLALAVLAPAALAQLGAGLLAARCAVLDEFARPAAAYAAGALLTAAVFAVLVDAMGADAIAVAVASGALVSLTVMWLVWRASERRAPAGGDGAAHPLATTTPALVRHLMRGAVPVLASQAAITVSVLSAARIAPGDATLYSYGSLAVAVLVAIVAAPVSIVLAPEVARRWDRRPETLVGPTLETFRLGALLLPLLALPGLLWGPSIAESLLTALSHADVVAVFSVAAILAVSVLSTLLSMVPLVASVAGGLLGRVGLGTVAVVAVHLVAAPLAAESGSLAVLAAEGSAAGIALAAVPIVVALRGEARRVAAGAARTAGRYVLPSAAVAGTTLLALGGATEVGAATAALAAGLLVQLGVALTVGWADLRPVFPAILSRG